MDDFNMPHPSDAPKVNIILPQDPRSEAQRSLPTLGVTNEHRSTWMTAYAGASNLRVVDLILPGSHNSGMDKEAAHQSGTMTCQDISPYHQLMAGIRVLDLRVKFESGWPVGHTERFRIVHGSPSLRTVTWDILPAVKSWRAHTAAAGDPKKEIVILDFHQFINFTDAAHDELMKTIKDEFGDLMIPPNQSHLYVRELLKGPGRVVVSYHDKKRDDQLFWDLNQRWSGEDTLSTDELEEFMDRVAGEGKPESELRSVQCAKMTKVTYRPDDFHGRIDGWFHSRDQNSYIQRFYIINTDWSTRGNYIDDCIHACFIRADAFRKVQWIWPNGESTFQIPFLATEELNVELTPQNRSDYLRLPVPRSGIEAGKLVIRNSSGRACTIYMEGSNYGGSTINLNDTVSASLEYSAEAQEYKFITPSPLPGVIDNFKAGLSDNNSIVLTWSSVPKHPLSYYSVLYWDDDTGSGVGFPLARVKENSFTVDDGRGGTFQVKVHGTHGNYESPKITFYSRIVNFSLKDTQGVHPLHLNWSAVGGVSEYRVIRRLGEDSVTFVVHEPTLLVESDGYGIWHVEATWQGGLIKSEDIVFMPKVPTEISNFRRTTPDVSYPLVLEWDAVPTVSEYEVVLEKTDGSVESRIVNQPRVSIERGAQGKWHVEATVIGQRIRSDTVGFSSPILEFYKFELEYYGQYPFTFEWTEIDGAQKYTAVWESAEGTTTYDVTEPRLEVKKDGVGRWYVTALDSENQPVRSPAVYFPPKITNFRLEDDGQYPFRLSWDPVPEVMVYTVRHLPIFGRVKYIDVTDPWLVVEEKGGGTWCVILEGTEGLEHLFSEVRRFTPPLAE